MNGIGRLDFWIQGSDTILKGETCKINNGKPHVVALRYLKKDKTWSLHVDGELDTEKKLENKPDVEKGVFKLCPKVVVFEPIPTHLVHHIKYSTNPDEFAT